MAKKVTKQWQRGDGVLQVVKTIRNGKTESKFKFVPGARLPKVEYKKR